MIALGTDFLEWPARSTAIDGNLLETINPDGDAHDTIDELRINRHSRWLLGLQPD